MLTPRQQEIWEFVVQYVDGHGYPPTVREIGEAVGLASPSTVHAHLANLERAGLLRRDPTKPRALELIGRERREPAAAEADARDGEIVVALAGDDEGADEATVKRFFRESGRVRLQPENDALEPLYPGNVQILGKVIGVFRSL